MSFAVDPNFIDGITSLTNVDFVVIASNLENNPNENVQFSNGQSHFLPIYIVEVGYGLNYTYTDPNGQSYQFTELGSAWTVYNNTLYKLVETGGGGGGGGGGGPTFAVHQDWPDGVRSLNNIILNNVDSAVIVNTLEPNGSWPVNFPNGETHDLFISIVLPGYGLNYTYTDLNGESYEFTEEDTIYTVYNNTLYKLVENGVDGGGGGGGGGGTVSADGITISNETLGILKGDLLNLSIENKSHGNSKVLTSNTKNKLLSDITNEASATTKHKIRRSYLKSILEDNNLGAEIKSIKLSKSDLGLSDKLGGEDVYVFKSGETIDVSNFSSTESFYCPLNNNESFEIVIGNQKTINFTRIDVNNEERYSVSIGGSFNITIKTGGANFNTSIPNSQNSYLVPNDEIIAENRILFIGSVGDGGSSGGGGGSTYDSQESGYYLHTDFTFGSDTLAGWSSPQSNVTGTLYRKWVPDRWENSNLSSNGYQDMGATVGKTWSWLVLGTTKYFDAGVTNTGVGGNDYTGYYAQKKTISVVGGSIDVYQGYTPPYNSGGDGSSKPNEVSWFEWRTSQTPTSIFMDPSMWYYFKPDGTGFVQYTTTPPPGVDSSIIISQASRTALTNNLTNLLQESKIFGQTKTLSTSIKNQLLTDISNESQATKNIVRRKSLKIILDSNDLGADVKSIKLKTSDLDLTDKLGGEDVYVFKNGETINIDNFSSTESFYCPLNNGEFTIINFGNNKTIKFTRTDSGSSERYEVLTTGNPIITIKTGGANFNTSDPSNNTSYLVPNDVIVIGTKALFIGSVGDGGFVSAEGDINLTAGNRVYLDNTQSNTAANQALQVDGGAYIKKDIWFSNNLNIADSGMILGDNTDIKSEEIVADSPLLIIGENNTSDNLLSGFINRYKDDSNNYKFTGLVRNTDSDKTFMLVNNVNPDTTNKDLDVTNFNNIATNTSNNHKDNYSSIYLTKLKGLSNQFVNSNISAITTQGSLGVSKNVYLGDSNHSNAQIHIGNNTLISYNKNDDAKFKFNTNVDIDLNTTNNKSINIFSNNNLTYQNSNDYTLDIDQSFTENITGTDSLSINDVSNTLVKGDLTIITSTNNRIFKGSYFINSEIPKLVPYQKNFSKTINNLQTYINKLDSNENYYSNYNTTTSNYQIQIDGTEKNIFIKNNSSKILEKETSVYKSDLIFKGSSSETYIKNNVVISNNLNKIIPFNYNKTQSLDLAPCTIKAINDNITIKNNINSQLPNNSLTTGDYNRFYYKDVSLTYDSDSTETLDKSNNLKYYHNINKICYDNNENKYNLVYDTYKGHTNITGTNAAGILTNHVNNRYSSTLYNDSNETYNKNKTINIGANLNIIYSNQYTETLNKVEINSSPDLSLSAQTKYSLNLNTTIGDNGASHLDKLVVQTNSNIFYNTISNETYKSNLVLQSQESNIKYNINYNLDCNSSSNLIESNFDVKCSNNLIETITNRTFSIRPVGGGQPVVPIVCVVIINESNGLISSGSTHKLPTEYVPTDTVSGVNLKRNDLVLFNYTPGTHTFSLDTQGGTVSNIDYSCLNGIYKIDFE